MIRGITGTGQGNGPFITFHDGFVAQAVAVADGGWDGFLTGADRIAIDQHAYLCFDTPNNDSIGYQSAKPCSYWASKFNTSMEQFGLSMGGEWSLASAFFVPLKSSCGTRALTSGAQSTIAESGSTMSATASATRARTTSPATSPLLPLRATAPERATRGT